MARASSGVIARAGDAVRRTRAPSAMTDRTGRRMRPPVRVRTSVMGWRPRSMLRGERFHVLQALHRLLLAEHAVADAARVERAALLVRELVVVREELLDLPLDRHEQPDVAREEVDRAAAFLHAALVGIHAEVLDERPCRHLA